MCENHRPDWDELCDCAGVFLTESQQKYLDSMKTPEDRKELLGKMYRGGADYTIDADCPVCSGFGRVGIQLAA